MPSYRVRGTFTTDIEADSEAEAIEQFHFGYEVADVDSKEYSAYEWDGITAHRTEREGT